MKLDAKEWSAILQSLRDEIKIYQKARNRPFADWLRQIIAKIETELAK